MEKQVSEDENIIKFYRKTSELTDRDITNLFAGFVALLKRKAIMDCEKKFNAQILSLKNKVRELESQLANSETDNK